MNVPRLRLALTLSAVLMAAQPGLVAAQATSPAPSPAAPNPSVVAAIRVPPPPGVNGAPVPIDQYIASSWQTLSRSMSECRSVADSKVTTVPILYLPAGMAVPAPVAAMQTRCHVEVRHLPRAIHTPGDVRPSEIGAEGLLYLPNRYVVPGGRFNEMYGWDSYFILLGLVQDREMALARGMVEDFFFEIENYGTILNANRTYYLTRSQPPFLTSMIREVYDQPRREVSDAPIPRFGPGGGTPVTPASSLGTAWLAHAYALAAKDYAFWVSPEHQAGTTGLARYKDLGAGPVPEMADDSTYYPDVIRWLLAHPGDHSQYLVQGPANPTPEQAATLARETCDPAASRVCAAAVVNGYRLSAAFYQGDRAMRESGFDTSFRYGPFSGSTEDYADVGLNALLFKYENDMAYFAGILNKPADVTLWLGRARARRIAMDDLLWDPAQGLYFDFNFTTGHRSTYHYVTTFYPLWAGSASAAQAAAVESHLNLFEQPGGLAESDVASGVQWDLPFGWAPTTWLAIHGLDQSGFRADAVRLARSFSATVRTNYQRDGTIREKYNVVDGSSNIALTAGYRANGVGFGWTNGVYLRLEQLLSRQ